MVFQIPVQDQRYADSGKRMVRIGNRDVSAALSALRQEDQVLFGATHQIFINKVPGVNLGMTIDFDGTPYRVIKITDPRANDPDMRGRYYRLICNPA